MSLRLPLRILAIGLLGACASAIAPVALGAMLDAQMPPGIPDSLSTLADQPATHTGFSFDRTEIQMAQAMLQQGGLDADRAAAALTGISFDMYKYKEPAFYTPETMAAILESFHRAGWKLHLSGHFGIPKVDPSAVMVPAPDGK